MKRVREGRELDNKGGDQKSEKCSQVWGRMK